MTVLPQLHYDVIDDYTYKYIYIYIYLVCYYQLLSSGGGASFILPSFLTFFSPKIFRGERRKGKKRGGACGVPAPFLTLAGVNISDWLMVGVVHLAVGADPLL